MLWRRTVRAAARAQWRGVICTNRPDLCTCRPGKDQIILESDAPYGSYDIRLTESGKLGFTREGYTYEFDYTPPVGKRLHLRIRTRALETVLQVGTFTRKKAVGKFIHDGTVRRSGIKNATLSIPCARIGSAGNAVNAEIYSLTLRG